MVQISYLKIVISDHNKTLSNALRIRQNGWELSEQWWKQCGEGFFILFGGEEGMTVQLL
jgi:hypothetical protein